MGFIKVSNYMNILVRSLRQNVDVFLANLAKSVYKINVIVLTEIIFLIYIKI